MTNPYLFALFCEGLVALLMVFGMVLWTACQVALARKKAEGIGQMVYKICEKTIGRTVHTIGEETRDLMDYAMDKTQEMVKKTFNNEDES